MNYQNNDHRGNNDFATINHYETVAPALNCLTILAEFLLAYSSTHYAQTLAGPDPEVCPAIHLRPNATSPMHLILPIIRPWFRSQYPKFSHNTFSPTTPVSSQTRPLATIVTPALPTTGKTSLLHIATHRLTNTIGKGEPTRDFCRPD